MDTHRVTYYSSNTFYRQSYMSLPAIDNRDSSSSSNEFYRTTNDVNYCALSSSQNIGCNEASVLPNNAPYHDDRSRTLSTDYIPSSNNDVRMR